ncbi:MAG: hypothetical protein IJ588_09970 [Prevotella sp.]|nr:hypothetical protein [Prevotella sp.]
MRRLTILLLALLMLGTAAEAQRNKRVTRKPAKPVVVEDPRIAQMLAATQQIMFIDSMVVDKADFVRHLPLSAECGTLEMKDSLMQFTNELGDHRLTTYFDASDSLCHMAQSDYIGNYWTTPERVRGIGDAAVNFPFLMPDGITLYMAQKGEKSLGGYDLFVTRYDGDEAAFLRAENLGMPFASDANDYLYAIDEKHQLGYFVTDRRQPEGKVCIYVFVPNATRKVYQSEAYGEEKLRSLARIDRIADTWTSVPERNQALHRLEAAKAEAARNGKQNAHQQPATELDNLRHQAEVLDKALLLARNYYAKANAADRQTLRGEIIKSEQELEALQLKIRQIEKQRRNAATRQKK